MNKKYVLCTLMSIVLFLSIMMIHDNNMVYKIMLLSYLIYKLILLKLYEYEIIKYLKIELYTYIGAFIIFSILAIIKLYLQRNMVLPIDVIPSLIIRTTIIDISIGAMPIFFVSSLLLSVVGTILPLETNIKKRLIYYLISLLGMTFSFYIMFFTNRIC